MFDAILENVASRFGISPDKARQLLGALTALIFDPGRGGPAGFVERFRSQGLGDAVQSWIGGGPNQTISPAQLESALGADEIAGIASRAGLDSATTGSVLSGMLPDVFNGLTEGGQLPAAGAIPDRLRGLVGEGAAAVTGAVASGAAAIGDKADRMAAAVSGRESSGDSYVPRQTAAPMGASWKWLWWLLLLAVLVGLGWYFLRGQPREATLPTGSATPPATAEATATPAAQFDSRLALTRNGDKVSYEGVVDSEATKTSIVDALTQAFGAGNVSGTINVDPNARTPGWLAALAGFLPQFTANGATLTFEGSRVDLGGNIADADKAGLLDKLKAAFGGFSFGGLFEGVGAAADATANVASAALEKLTPGQFSADDLVKALNLMIIHFDTGSARISAESLDILKKAAAAIKQAPSGTRIEVGGHTDNTGNAASNQKLSQARAEAVAEQLIGDGVDAGMLSSKGHGQDKPVADNATAEGKAKNRRIEFTVQP